MGSKRSFYRDHSMRRSGEDNTYLAHKRILHVLVLLGLSISAYAGATEERAIDHAPLGVMGDHLHKKGEWMISLRAMVMRMSGNALDGDAIPDSTVLEQKNPFAHVQGMPAKLSVIPRNMDMTMSMLGVMYAPSDSVTLMGMAMYTTKEMELDTYQGMMGRGYLGSFEISNSNITSLSGSALFEISADQGRRWHAQVGLEKSVGPNKEVGTVLSPMNMRPMIILPYGMQAGDKSLRLVTSITNVNRFDRTRWGNQLVMKNALRKDNWRYGDEIGVSTWLQRSITDFLSYSIRLEFKQIDQIRGRDLNIVAPVQTANPENYGGNNFSIGFGLNGVFNIFGGENRDRLSVELTRPLSHNKNGLQLKDDWSFVVGFQKTL